MRIVKRESWFSRTANSFGGVVFGIILSLVSLPLLFWNEGRAVKTARGLAEGSRLVVSVPAESIDAAHESHLVHVQGPTFCEGDLADDEFGVHVNAIRLSRVVEMYQWQERKETERKRRVGGSADTIETYTYSKAWSPQLIDSGKFQERTGHENPPAFPIAARVEQAREVFLGSFQLPPVLIEQINASEPLVVARESVSEPLRQHLQERPGELYWAVNSEATVPQVGDARIRFLVTRPSDVSVVAQQRGKLLESYETTSGSRLQMLAMGRISAQDMFDQAKTANAVLTWVLRGVGSLLTFIGFALLLRPLSVMADVIPIAGSIVGAGTTVVAFLLAGIVALMTISVGWIAYRPWLGLSLLAGAAGIAYLLFRRVRQGQAAPNAPQVLATPGPAGPPPMPPPVPRS